LLFHVLSPFNELPRRKLRGIRAIAKFVTPAQADVQKAQQDWIPAFAGMTAPQQAAGNETASDSKA
jgi:hypothetical protein